jgi:hypothetical protein
MLRGVTAMQHDDHGIRKERVCPYCTATVPLDATECTYCRSPLPELEICKNEMVQGYSHDGRFEEIKSPVMQTDSGEKIKKWFVGIALAVIFLSVGSYMVYTDYLKTKERASSPEPKAAERVTEVDQGDIDAADAFLAEEDGAPSAIVPHRDDRLIAADFIGSSRHKVVQALGEPDLEELFEGSVAMHYPDHLITFYCNLYSQRKEVVAFDMFSGCKLILFAEQDFLGKTMSEAKEEFGPPEYEGVCDKYGEPLLLYSIEKNDMVINIFCYTVGSDLIDEVHVRTKYPADEYKDYY